MAYNGALKTHFLHKHKNAKGQNLVSANNNEVVNLLGVTVTKRQLQQHSNDITDQVTKENEQQGEKSKLLSLRAMKMRMQTVMGLKVSRRRKNLGRI